MLQYIYKNFSVNISQQELWDLRARPSSTFHVTILILVQGLFLIMHLHNGIPFPMIFGLPELWSSSRVGSRPIFFDSPLIYQYKRWVPGIVWYEFIVTRPSCLTIFSFHILTCAFVCVSSSVCGSHTERRYYNSLYSNIVLFLSAPSLSRALSYQQLNSSISCICQPDV